MPTSKQTPKRTPPRQSTNSSQRRSSSRKKTPPRLTINSLTSEDKKFIREVISDNYSSISIENSKEDATSFSINQLQWMMEFDKRRIDYGLDFLHMSDKDIFSLFWTKKGVTPSLHIPFTHRRSAPKIREFFRTVGMQQKPVIKKCEEDSVLSIYKLLRLESTKSNIFTSRLSSTDGICMGVDQHIILSTAGQSDDNNYLDYRLYDQLCSFQLNLS